MGCDIHGVVERKVKDRWITINILQVATPARARNYPRFAALAGVRGDGPEPRGIPDDVSETAKCLIDDIGADGHSHSWEPLQHAATVFAATAYYPDTEEGRRTQKIANEYPASYFFDVKSETVNVCPTCQHRDVTGLDAYRLVFWFDN